MSINNQLRVACFFLLFFSGFIFYSNVTRAQDTSHISKIHLDSSRNTIAKKSCVIHSVAESMKENLFFCTQKKSNNIIEHVHQEVKFRQILFYIIFSLFFFFAILKVGFNNYTNNLIKVFFNTTLRQSQLTEQLLLAKLPSLLYNLFFLLVVSIYIFVLLVVKLNPIFFDWKLLMYILISVSLIYTTKYIVLELSGWLTGYKQEVENYVFVVFLINKILAILLLPILLLISFSYVELASFAVKLSYALVFLLYFLRYFRAFSLLNRRLSISKLHFMIYAIGIEIIPILLIYKSLVIIINKSL